MELQQEIAFEKVRGDEGTYSGSDDRGKVAMKIAYVGRTYMDSPNVDGLIL